MGDNQVFRGIDMRINAGEVVVSMGANEAGKSTLIKAPSGYQAAELSARKIPHYYRDLLLSFPKPETPPSSTEPLHG